MVDLTLPPIVRQHVNLLNGPQFIEFGIVDGVLKAMVPGSTDFIVVNPGERLRVRISSDTRTAVLAEIETSRIVPDGEQDLNDRQPRSIVERNPG